MTVIESAARHIKQFEGCSLTPYLDAAGYPTAGYGHLLTLDKHIPLERFSSITQAIADQWLEEDITKALIGVDAELDGHGPFTDNQIAALCSLVFNIGLAAFKASTVRSKLVTVEPPDIRAAANAFLLWNKITVNGKKIVSVGLMNRRKAEKALFLTEDKQP